MDQNERGIIDELFAKLGEAETRSGPRDAEAETLIGAHTASQPAAPYYMAQAILVQQQALASAQTRLEDLERQLAERPAAGGGFLSGLFGSPSAVAGNRAPAPRRASSPATAAGAGRGGGGGFMAGAAQTAMGVAGGLLIADMVGGLFGSDEAAAAELQDSQPLEEEPRPMADDDLDDGGGDFGFDDF